MLKGLVYIFGFLLLGEGITRFFEIPVAGNILGMFLIFFALRFKLVKLEQVKPASDKLIQYLVLFFIPYGVGLMEYFNILTGYWPHIILAVIFSSLLSMYLTAIILEKLGKE